MTEQCTLNVFFCNTYAYAAFLARVESAIADKALAVRCERSPARLTAPWAARQGWAIMVLANTTAMRSEAERLIPALADEAREAGLMTTRGEILATVMDIRRVLTDGFVDRCAAGSLAG